MGKVIFIALVSLVYFCTAQENVTSSTIVSTTNSTTTSSTTLVSSTSTTSQPISSQKPAELNLSNATTTTSTKSPSTTASTTTTVAPTVKPEKIVQLGPEVTIKSGKLRPLLLKSRKDREYYAALGVPYAADPSQFQRFKSPAPVGPWDNVLNATEFAPPCVQYNILSDEIEGVENCLMLNVFTPKLYNASENSPRFPVLFFIHQGAFMFGSSRDYEAKYLMDENVVLVTIAYRLGAFGFLNTEGDSDVYGNMGLKDQVLALEWVRDNIETFNGEKNLVTIMGESAGGASVHYHLLSDRSKGLYSRAISMSGTALSPWAFTRTPRKNAKKLGTMLNCPTTDMYELFICLQGKDALDIVKKQKEFFEWGTDPISPFGPSVEVTKDQHSAFIKESPYALINKGQINDQAPWLLGVVEDVCLLDAYSVLVDPQLVAEMNIDWHRIAPLAFSFRDTAIEPDAVSNQIRAFYFGSKEVSNETAKGLVNLYSDRWFNYGTSKSAVLHGKKNEAVPIYLYVFSYQGKESHLKFFNIQEKLGVSEGDELQYLFNMNRFTEIKHGDEDEDLSDKFIKLFVSFASEGKPTNTWSDQPFKPMSIAQVKGDEGLMYYKIDKNCSFVNEPWAERMSFWENLPINEGEKEVENSYARDDIQSADLH